MSKRLLSLAGAALLMAFVGSGLSACIVVPDDHDDDHHGHWDRGDHDDHYDHHDDHDDHDDHDGHH